MATGRIGVTPTLRTRWSKQPSAGTTSLSGLDDNSVSLVYDVGYEAVYRNGVLLSRGNDYTATSGTSITLIDATLTGDVIEVLANQLVPLTDAISKGQFTAKGALLSATAASTPGVITVGANDTVLTADSSTATGLKWATPSSGGITLISETTASGLSSLSLSSIPSTYKNLVLSWQGVYISDSTTQFGIRFNNDSTSAVYKGIGARPSDAGSIYGINSTDSTNATNIAAFPIGMNTSTPLNGGNGIGTLTIFNYASTSKLKQYHYQFSYNRASSGENISWLVNGMYNTTSAITSIDIFRISGSGTFSNNTDTTFRLDGVA